MSIFSRRERREFLPLQNSGFGTVTNWSGEPVNESTALQVSAVMACVGLIADSVASLPLRSTRRVGDRNIPMDVPALFLDPSSTVTAYELIHQTITSLALHGNSYIYVDRSANGTPIALTPLSPTNVNVVSLNVGTKDK